MTAKQQILTRYPDAHCYKFQSTQEYEVWIPSRQSFDSCVFWGGKTPIHAWIEALKILDKELLKKLES